MNLERSDDVPGTEPLLPERDHSRQKSLRENLKCRMQSRNWHWFILCLVASDFFCVMTSITITFLWPEKEQEEHYVIETLSIIAFVINTVFVIEVILNLFVFGVRYFLTGSHWFIHLFDASVVIMTFLLELSLKGKEREVAGLLIVFRFWRLIKVLSSVAVGLGEYDEEKVEELEKKIEELEGELKSLLITVDQISKEDDWDESKRDRVVRGKLRVVVVVVQRKRKLLQVPVISFCELCGLNTRPSDLQSDALPTELNSRVWFFWNRNRQPDNNHPYQNNFMPISVQ
ncbi:12926_t:CDS:2 [Acaulospora morrowiae]|uniref:Voltage-gated hydrogen channel 1 n=1 Tax=Acaulospora morrowiae TaxID=94023 RepID=A0A9N8ZZ73_9GLOM|nr:12926_t:CDS:2 [Acaulospora morrowiae]